MQIDSVCKKIFLSRSLVTKILKSIWSELTCCQILLRDEKSLTLTSSPVLSYSVNCNPDQQGANATFLSFSQKIKLLHTHFISTAPASTGSTPRRRRTPFAFGGTLIAAPNSLARRDCSKIYQGQPEVNKIPWMDWRGTIGRTVTLCPALRNAIAAVRPPNPAPTIKMFKG